MKPSPIPCVWDGEAFRPLDNFRRIAARDYGDGEIVTLAPHEERSMASHRHYFSIIKEAWENLPEDQAERFPSPEHLRKYSLIKAGYANEQIIACASNAEARRWAAIMGQSVEFSIVVPRGVVVSVFRPQSQSVRAMGKKAFQESKDKVLGIVADLIAVAPEALQQRAREVA